MFKILFYLVLSLCFYFLYNYINIHLTEFSNELEITVLAQLKNLILSFSIIFLSLFIIKIINLFFIEYFIIKRAKIALPKFLIQILDVLIFLVFLILILNKIYGVSLTVLIATSSAVGVGIAYGMRDIITDIFAGIALQIEKPFKIGDSVEFEDTCRGIIRDITWRSTFVETVYHTLISVPNSKVNSMNIINFNRPKKIYKLVEEFYLSYQVPIEKVRRIVLSVLISENINLESDQVNIHVKKLDTKGIKYLITFYCTDIFSELITRTNVLSKIISKLQEANLQPNYEIFDINYTPKKLDLENTEKIDFLKRIDLFSNLKENSLNNLVSNLKELKVKKDRTIIKEGDEKCTCLYLLKEGLLEVFVKDKNINKDIKVSILESGNYFGEFSLLTGKPRSATVKSKTEVILYEIDFELMKQLLKEDLNLSEYLSNILTERQISNNQMLNSYCSIVKEDKQKIRSKIINKMKKIFKLL